MLLEEDIRQLLKIKTESKNLDYKEGLNWDVISAKDQKLEIVKDILAMANTQDGGKIILGVRNSDYEPIGLNEENFNSFDQTKVNEFLQKYTDPKFSCQVYKNIIEGKNIVVIDVPEFQEVPVICKQDAHSSIDKSKQILKRGQIYIRTEKGATEAIPSSQEMRELLGRAIIKKGDELLHNIERLIKGKPLKPTEESEEKYREEIKEADNFLSDNIGEELKKYGYWEVIAYPILYNPKRIQDQKTIKELVEKSQVRLTGWPFPHTDYENTSNFLKGTQSYTASWDVREGYSAYQSGLFIWKKIFGEDVPDGTTNNKPVLSFVNAIQYVTEFFLFFRRYYEEISLDSDLHIDIVLNRTKDRMLVPAEFLDKQYLAKVDFIPIKEDIKVVYLRAAFKEIANYIVRQIFAVFNCNKITEAMVDYRQTQLLRRNF